MTTVKDRSSNGNNQIFHVHHKQDFPIVGGCNINVHRKKTWDTFGYTTAELDLAEESTASQKARPFLDKGTLKKKMIQENDTRWS